MWFHENIDCPVGKRLHYTVNGGETRRYHGIPLLRDDRVDSHSWRVAQICLLVSEAEEPGTSLQLIMAALDHDVPEHRVGDMPAPTKRSVPGLREQMGQLELASALGAGLMDWDGMLTERERWILKFADAVDGCLNCIRERAMGNRLIADCYGTFLEYVNALMGYDALQPGAKFNERAVAIVAYINQQWEEANGR